MPNMIVLLNFWAMRDIQPLPEHGKVTEEMQALIERWQPAGDARAVFLSCYSLMTNNVFTAIDEGAFIDPLWVNRLLQRFAGYYFEALETYERGSTIAPAVWQVAFDSAKAGDQQPLQLLLLGVNAHINYDLVLTLVDMLQPEWPVLSSERREQRYADHCHINDVIGRTIDVVQDEIVEPLSPEMDRVDRALGPLDEWLTSTLISRWREEVWQNALRWLAAGDAAEQEAVREQVEQMTLKRAEAISLNGGVLALRHLL